ncbi:MAG: ABC transporter ATP-binding protein [Erysipelotrichaceae bacterium]|nr:ABC transporter ATP-binding protein [Erysipelotrichaceae bacterium]
MFRLLKKYTKDGWWACLLGPLMVILEVIFDVAIPYVMSLIIDQGITARGGDIDYIVKMGLVMMGLALLAGVCGALSGIFASIASCRFVRNIRMAMLEKIQTYDFRNIEKFPVSSVVVRMTSDMRMMRMAYVSIVRMLVRTPVNLIFTAIMIVRLNSTLALVFAVAIPVLGAGLIYIMAAARPRFRILMSKFDGMNADLKENIEGIRVAKTFVRADYEEEKFKKVSDDVMASQRFAENVIILNQPFFELVMYACMIAVAWYGGNFIIAGSLTTGQFMSYLSYLRQILFSLLGISMALMQIVNARASVDRANEILYERPYLDDSKADPNLELTDGSVEFRNVFFKYFEDAEKPTLSGIDLKISSGERIGILGPTGAGKSTLVQLIPRLYDIYEGEIIVGGHDIKDYTIRNLREAVAMVLQKNTLFSGTIEENMKWGDPDATHEEVVEACRNAQAHDFIMSFPDGYETMIEQGGTNVSGGQRQRLCIARALLKHPKIIILDDSTSAVDTDTDHRIQEALKKKLSNMTTIIIAQRVSSVRECDRIIVMNDGRIEDIGTHDELIERNEVYRDLYETQQKGVAE